MSRCPWTLRWGTSAASTTQCDLDDHIRNRQVVESSDGSRRFAVQHDGSPHHEGPGLAIYPDQRISWIAGDRREYTGDWPGYCPRLGGEPFRGGCVLPAGHHGNCAP